MLRSITRSAVLILALLALVGAGQGPTTTADEVPEHLSRVARVETDHDQHGPRCAEGHEREYQGGTTCDHYCYDDVPGYGDDRWNKHRCEGDRDQL